MMASANTSAGFLDRSEVFDVITDEGSLDRSEVISNLTSSQYLSLYCVILKNVNVIFMFIRSKMYL